MFIPIQIKNQGLTSTKEGVGRDEDGTGLKRLPVRLIFWYVLRWDPRQLRHMLAFALSLWWEHACQSHDLLNFSVSLKFS
jgi:hypothetical protein